MSPGQDLRGEGEIGLGQCAPWRQFPPSLSPELGSSQPLPGMGPGSLVPQSGRPTQNPGSQDPALPAVALTLPLAQDKGLGWDPAVQLIFY